MHLDVERVFFLKFVSFHVSMLQVRDEPSPVRPRWESDVWHF